MSLKTSLEKQYNKMADFDYSKKFDKNRFNKFWARKWGFTSNGGDTTDPNDEMDTLRSMGVLGSYSVTDVTTLDNDLAESKKYKAEAEEKLGIERVRLVEYTKSFKVYNDLIAAPYWASVSEEQAEAYAKANEEFADASAVDDAFTREDKDTEFRAAFEAYTKSSSEKAKVDLKQKALELVEAQTWTGATADADIQTWYESAAIKDAYLKTAFSYLTDAQLLEIKTDSEAAKATVGQMPVEQFKKITTSYEAEAAEIGAGGNLAQTVSEWSDAKAKEDQTDWTTTKAEEAKAREKANTEATLSADAYVKVGVGTQFLVAPIEKAIPILEARIASETSNEKAIVSHKVAALADAKKHADRKDAIKEPKPDALKDLDFPTARQTYRATLNDSFGRIKKLILEAVAKNEYKIKLHQIYEHEFEVLIHLGYEITQVTDTSTDKTASHHEKLGVDVDLKYNYEVRWSNLEIAQDEDREHTWYAKITQKKES